MTREQRIDKLLKDLAKDLNKYNKQFNLNLPQVK